MGNLTSTPVLLRKIYQPQVKALNSLFIKKVSYCFKRNMYVAAGLHVELEIAATTVEPQS